MPDEMLTAEQQSALRASGPPTAPAANPPAPPLRGPEEVRIERAPTADLPKPVDQQFATKDDLKKFKDDVIGGIQNHLKAAQARAEQPTQVPPKEDAKPEVKVTVEPSSVDKKDEPKKEEDWTLVFVLGLVAALLVGALIVFW